MMLSFGSMVTCLVLSSILVLYLSIVMKYTRVIFSGGVKFVLVGIILVMIRMVIPFEFPFTYTIPSDKILPLISVFFHVEIPPYNITVARILLVVWIVVAVIRLLLFAIKQYKFQKMIRIMPTVNTLQIQTISKEINQKFKNPVAVRVVQIPQILSPMITGMVRPTVILPNVAYTDQELTYILKHEVEHYYRHDLWLKMAVELFACIYWWNPVAYLVKKQVVTAFEMANDIDITQTLGEHEKLEYLSCLLKTAKSNYVAPSNVSLCFVGGNHSNLKRRFDVIMKFGVVHKVRAYALINLSVIFLLSAASYTVVFEPYILPPEVEATTVEWSIDNTYFVKNGQRYDVYVDEKYFVTLDALNPMYSDYTVYEKEEMPHEKTYK